jgi:CRISPR/Cas system-associated endonuclease Cas3-HD
MAIFDFLKRKELAEIATLKQSLAEASSKIARLQELNGELEPLRKYSSIRDVEIEGIRLKLENEELIRYRNIILDDYDKSLRDKQHALDILDDEVLLQHSAFTLLYTISKS